MTVKPSPVLLCIVGLCAGALGGWFSLPDAPASARSAKTSVITPALPSPPSAVSPANTAPDTCLQQIASHLDSGSPPDGLQLQVLFMQWFEGESNLWPRFEELRKQYPSSEPTLTKAFFTAWAWHDCAAACEKAPFGGNGAADAAWAVACALKHPKLSDLTYHAPNPDLNVLERLASRDPKLALEIAYNVRRSASVYNGTPPGIEAMVRGWVTADPEAAIKWAADYKGEGASPFRLACLTWDQRDPGALSRLQSPLKEMVEADGVLALLAGRSCPVSQYSASIAALSRDPCATVSDVTALLNSISASPPADFRKFSLSYSTDWQPSDFEASLTALLALPKTAPNDLLASSMVKAWSAGEPEKAKAWSEEHGVKPEPVTSWVVTAESEATASLPPAEAVAKLLAGPLDSRTTVPLGTALKRMVRDDPNAASSFLQSHMADCTAENPPSGQIDWRRVFTVAASGWSSENLPAASAWAASLPAGPARDAAAIGLVEALRNYDPEAAFTWMTSMQNRTTGSSEMQSVLRQIQDVAGTAPARRAVKMSSLPEPEKQKLLKSL